MSSHFYMSVVLLRPYNLDFLENCSHKSLVCLTVSKSNENDKDFLHEAAWFQTNFIVILFWLEIYFWIDLCPIFCEKQALGRLQSCQVEGKLSRKLSLS